MLTDFCTDHKLSAAAAFFCCFLTVGLSQTWNVAVSKKYIVLYTQNSLQYYAWGLAKMVKF